MLYNNSAQIVMFATLTPYTINRSNVDIAPVSAAGGGDEFANDGKKYFFAYNGDASPVTITFETPGTVDGLAVADKAATIAAGDYALLGPFPPQWYNDSDGLVQVTYSGVTSLTVRVLHIEGR